MKARRQLIAKLHPEDAAELRKVYALREAMYLNPGAFSAQEIVAALTRYADLVAGLLERYQVDTSQPWHINAFSGAIYHGSEECDD